MACRSPRDACPGSLRRFVKSAGQAMVGDSQIAMQDLMNMLTDQEKPFRLRPRKPLGTKQRNEVGVWSVLFKAVMRRARMSRNRRRGFKSHPAKTTPVYHQRCAVRITYARNTVKGQWAAHGRYVACESAQRTDATAAVGFDGQGEIRCYCGTPRLVAARR